MLLHVFKKTLWSGNRDTVVEGLLPLKKYRVTVTAVYKDEAKKEGSAEYMHSGRLSRIATRHNLSP